MRAAFLAMLLSGGVFAQTPILVNPDFEQGQPGARPLGWLFGFGPNKLSYSALTVSDSCYSGKQCAMTKSNELIPAGSHSFLYQYVDAKPYRGMKFRFRAAVRTTVSGSPDGAGLLVRIHRVSGESCFFNNMSEGRIGCGAGRLIVSPPSDDADPSECRTSASCNRCAGRRNPRSQSVSYRNAAVVSHQSPRYRCS